MEEIRYPEDFSLEDLAHVYISEAFKLAEENPVTEDFDNKLYGAVAQKMRITREAVLCLHHSFYWAFFNDKDSDSPLEYTQTSNHGTHVTLKRPCTEEDISKLTTFVSKKYGWLLREKMKSPEQRAQEIEGYYRRRIQKLIQQS